jgi:dTDP-4-dehydrorhamnose 3,5-epimerase-like enzyme
MVSPSKETSKPNMRTPHPIHRHKPCNDLVFVVHGGDFVYNYRIFGEERGFVTTTNHCYIEGSCQIPVWIVHEVGHNIQGLVKSATRTLCLSTGQNSKNSTIALLTVYRAGSRGGIVIRK